MKISIFGSCVSRDTCEYISNAETLVYIARQSATSLVESKGSNGVDLNKLKSSFQRRMVEGDLSGDAKHRLATSETRPDVILIDLVDERRGYWIWPDGSSATNTIETEYHGLYGNLESEGARLVHFGSDEHFERWAIGFNRFVRALHTTGLIDRAIFLDIPWASKFEASHLSRSESASRSWLREVRRISTDVRTNSRQVYHRILGEMDSDVIESGTFPERAYIANSLYKRYRKVAINSLNHSVSRSASEVRVGSHHKWGPQPFHYADSDYESIANGIVSVYEDLNQNQ